MWFSSGPFPQTWKQVCEGAVNKADVQGPLHLFDKLTKHKFMKSVFTTIHSISSDRECSKFDMLSCFAAWCEDGELNFKYS